MARRHRQALTVKKKLAANEANGDGIYEIGTPIDLGITLSIYGRNESGKIEVRDKRLLRLTTDTAPAGIDTWPTEH